MVMAVTTMGFLPVERAWRAMLELMRAVVNSVSACEVEGARVVEG